MNKLLSLSFLSLSLTTVACKGGAGGGGDAPALPAEMTSWMPKDASAAWQGAWASRLTVTTGMQMSFSDNPAAIEIKGTDATVYDGKTEHKLKLALTAPCIATFSLTKDGATNYYDKQFLVVGGKVMAGGGAAGYRKGKAAIVCTTGMDDVITLDDKGDCKKWSNFMNRWTSKPEKCTWSQAEGKDVLEIGDGNFTTKLHAGEGDILTTDQFDDEAKLTEKTADMAAAKAKTDETIKSKQKG